MDTWIKKLGKNKGRPRIFLDGVQAVRAGFSPGASFDVEVAESRVSLIQRADGSRTVSSRKRGEGVMPVVDLNSQKLLEAFEGMEAIRVVVTKGAVHILPLASEVKRVKRLERLRTKLREGQALLGGSVSHGGGVLAHAIHQGLQDAGIESSLAMANEIREDMLLQAIEHNDIWDESTMALQLPMQELVQDDWLMSKLPDLDYLEAGIPCSGASKAGKSSNAISLMEEHEEVGHLVAAFLAIVNKTQPGVVLVENVPDYAHTASAFILRYTLRDMGYDTHEVILDGKDFGCLEGRVRWAMVACTRGMAFDMKDLQPAMRVVRKVEDVLDKTIALDDPRWRAVTYLKEKMERNAAEGNGFRMQYIDPKGPTVPTLRRFYHKGGSTDPRLPHPETPELSRLLTAGEHARIKGVPPALIDDMSETMAHQLLGQGIVYEPFRALGERIAQCLIAHGAGEFLEAEVPEEAQRPRQRICG